jgi:hypothetical protein
MSRLRRRPHLALAAPVILTALALGSLTAALDASPAGAAVANSASPIEVVLGTLTPVAPQPGDTLVVSGTMHNVSDATVSNLALQLRLGSPLGSRSEFDTYAADPEGDLSNLFSATEPVPAELPSLAAGAQESFRLALHLDPATLSRLALPLGAWQVRELGVAVTGTSSLGTGPVGQLRTFLPWAPRQASYIGYPDRVAWVWPLVDRPHRDAAGAWFDDTLAPQLSTGGRLHGLLAAGLSAESQRTVRNRATTVNVPVTWAIDPLLLDDVRAMTTKYQVMSGRGASQTTGATIPGTGTTAARTWLAHAQSATTRNNASVVSLPYADPDVAAAARAGMATSIGVATTSGHAIVQRDLGTVRSLPYGLPIGGLADQRTVEALRASGDTALVLSDQALPIIGGQPAETPSARTAVTTADGQLPTLLTDSGLNADVVGGVDDPYGTRLSLQLFLAETLMIQAEAPYDQRDLVIAPPQRWNPSPGYAAELLADTGKVPWIQPVGLQTARNAPIYTKVQRSGLTYPASARAAELSPAYLARVTAVRSQIGDFAAVLPAGDPQTLGYTASAQQALSSAWRGQPRVANSRLTALSNELSSAMSQVHIASHPGSFVTLTSHGGKVPVTIANDLDTPVNVIVQVAANQRLDLSHRGRVAVAIPARQQTVVDVQAASKTSGVFPVQVQLLTPKGHRYGPPTQLFIRSTVYGKITLVITGAATAALMITVAVRLTRRALAARRSSATAGS